MSIEQGQNSSEIEQLKRELEVYLEDASVGTPKFMAFWDHVDLAGIAVDSERAQESRNPEYVNSVMMREEVVDGRISGRRAEIPGYNDPWNTIGEFSSNLAYAFEVLNEERRTGRLFDEKPNSQRFSYLYRLRESILAKTS